MPNRLADLHATYDQRGTLRHARALLADLKRSEAEQRNAATAHRRTRAHREGRCGRKSCRG